MNSDMNNCQSPEWDEIKSGLPIEYFHQLIIQDYGSLLNFRLAFLEYCRQKKEKTTHKRKKISKNKSILDVATNFGLKLKKSGKAYFTICVFHAERTPSLAIYPNTNRYYCYGCGAKGNAYDLEEHLKRSEKCSG